MLDPFSPNVKVTTALCFIAMKWLINDVDEGEKWQGTKSKGTVLNDLIRVRYGQVGNFRFLYISSSCLLQKPDRVFQESILTLSKLHDLVTMADYNITSENYCFVERI